MKHSGARARRDERGATLILAIGFMLVIGGIGAGVVSSVATGLNGRTVLDRLRNREYAADGAVEYAIASVRQLKLDDPDNPGGPAVADCGPNNHYSRKGPDALNGIDIWVDCSNQRTLVDGLLQRNVVFTACVDTGFVDDGNPKCAGATIVRAQVNYQAKSAGALMVVTRTWVQSWSVNR